MVGGESAVEIVLICADSGKDTTVGDMKCNPIDDDDDEERKFL